MPGTATRSSSPSSSKTEIDALFERFDEELGPFPIVLADDEPSTDFVLDEWSTRRPHHAQRRADRGRDPAPLEGHHRDRRRRCRTRRRRPARRDRGRRAAGDRRRASNPPTARSARCSSPPTSWRRTRSTSTPGPRSSISAQQIDAQASALRPGTAGLGSRRARRHAPSTTRSSPTARRPAGADESEMIGLAQELRSSSARTSDPVDRRRRIRPMLLAELEVWHTRQPFRRDGSRSATWCLPVDPAPGFGGLLLGSIVAAHLGGIDDDFIPDIHRLIGEVERGERIVQPRLRHRFQVDQHGLAVSRHRLVGHQGDGDRRHLVRLPDGRHRPRPGARCDLRRRAARPRTPPQDRPGPAEGGSLAGADRLGADRPSRRFADAGARSAGRSPRVGDGDPRLRARRQGAVEARDHGAVPHPHARRPSRPRRCTNSTRRRR